MTFKEDFFLIEIICTHMLAQTHAHIHTLQKKLESEIKHEKNLCSGTGPKEGKPKSFIFLK